ncbi:MAG: transposase [Chloroflexota bacterium]
MRQVEATPKRFIGLDVHKHYLVAAGVDADQHEVLSPRRVTLSELAGWVEKTLTPADALVLEMSTNSFQLYDDLVAHVHSVTLVHPSHVALITQAQVKTDRKAALHAAKLLPAVWVPPLEVRDIRALVAQRHAKRMVRLATQAKNRLHRRRFGLPETGGLFAPENRAWWLDLPLSALEKVRLQSDLSTLDFAQVQLNLLEQGFKTIAAGDERLPLLVQLPGISLISAVALLAAIGDIGRGPGAAAGLPPGVADRSLAARGRSGPGGIDVAGGVGGQGRRLRWS